MTAFWQRQCRVRVLAGAGGNGGRSRPLSTRIGAITSTPHGLGVGVLLPYVLDAIRPAAQIELANVARALAACEADGRDTRRSGRGSPRDHTVGERGRYPAFARRARRC